MRYCKAESGPPSKNIHLCGPETDPCQRYREAKHQQMDHSLQEGGANDKAASHYQNKKIVLIPEHFQLSGLWVEEQSKCPVKCNGGHHKTFTSKLWRSLNWRTSPSSYLVQNGRSLGSLSLSEEHQASNDVTGHNVQIPEELGKEAGHLRVRVLRRQTRLSSALVGTSQRN